MSVPRKTSSLHIPIDLTLWIGGLLTWGAIVWFIISVVLGLWFPEVVVYAESVGIWAVWKKVGYLASVCGPVTIWMSMLLLNHRIHNRGGDCVLELNESGVYSSVGEWISRFFSVMLGENIRHRRFFFGALFEMLGRISAADGVVSATERAFVVTLTQSRFVLSQREIDSALASFQSGVQSTDDVAKYAQHVADRLSRAPELLRLLLDLLSELSQVDGDLHDAERAALEVIAQKFRMRLKRARSSPPPTSTEPSSQSPHEVLGVPVNASSEEITRAFRKLALQYHPDRSVLRGLPPEFSTVSKDRFLEVREAYERLKKGG